jgi:hypothetical protein
LARVDGEIFDENKVMVQFTDPECSSRGLLEKWKGLEARRK